MEIVTEAEVRARRASRADRRSCSTRCAQGIVEQLDARVRRRCSPPRGCGTTASSTRATPPGAGASTLSICREGRGAHAAVRSPSASRGCEEMTSHATDPRTRGSCAETLRSDASSTARSIPTSTSGRRQAPSPPTSCSRSWATPAFSASTSRTRTAARGSTTPTPWSWPETLGLINCGGDADGDRRADRHGDAGAGPLRQRRAARASSWRRRSPATSWPASA